MYRLGAGPVKDEPLAARPSRRRQPREPAAVTVAVIFL